MDRLPKFPEESLLAERLKNPYAIETYDKLTLGMQIKKFRKKAGLTQKELALKLHTSQSVIARMESGKQNFTLRTLIHIGFILGKKVLIRFQ